MMEHYFDAHLYLANWGTHRRMPQIQMCRAGYHWHAAKVAFERNWWRTWF